MNSDESVVCWSSGEKKQHDKGTCIVFTEVLEQRGDIIVEKTPGDTMTFTKYGEYLVRLKWTSSDRGIYGFKLQLNGDTIAGYTPSIWSEDVMESGYHIRAGKGYRLSIQCQMDFDAFTITIHEKNKCYF